jgi:phosphoadenosine phosphosulfate reductase
MITLTTEAVAALSEQLAPLPAAARVARALDLLPGPHVLSSAFGAQSAVMLHLVTQQVPDIPVVVVDTGYLFAETYHFIETLTEKLKLNLHVYAAPLSPARHEALHGRLWEQGVDGLDRYNAVRKLEPMRRGLQELGTRTWFTGLRRAQSSTRASIGALALQDSFLKVHPLFDWTDRDIGVYMKRHGLPYHPLWDKGYVSIGDWHTTRPLHEAGSAEATRFHGLKRECGLHTSLAV